MDRLEQIRIKADAIIEQMASSEERKLAYVHLYGTSMFAGMLANLRHLDGELCQIMAMLHDLAVYASNPPQKKHAQKGAELAEQLLKKEGSFTAAQIQLIIHAIAVHSDKQLKDDSPYAELLKDADVLAHYFYNPQIPIHDREQVRLYYVLEELRKGQK